jgi:hypothetical protein
MNFNGTYTDSTAAGHSDIVIRGNNPTDPYQAAGGEEVAAFDELSALYSNVRVLSSRIVLTISNMDSSHAVTAILLPSHTSSSLSNSSGTPAMPYARSIVIQHPNTGSIESSMSTNRILGKRDRAPLDEDCCCLSMAAPAKEWYWHMVLNGAIGVAALNVRYSVTCYYLCEWYGLQYLSQT